MGLIRETSKVPEGHHPRGTTLREALRGNLPLRGLCRGLSKGSAGSLRGFCGVSAGLCRVPRDFPRVSGGVTLSLWPFGTAGKTGGTIKPPLRYPLIRIFSVLVLSQFLAKKRTSARNSLLFWLFARYSLLFFGRLQGIPCLFWSFTRHSLLFWSFSPFFHKDFTPQSRKELTRSLFRNSEGFFV